jgi:Heliorhodopsin
MAKKKETQPKQKQVVSDSQRQTLRKWNMWLGLGLIAEALAVLLLAGGQTVPLTMQYLATDTLASDAAGHEVLAVATRHLWDVPLAWVVAKFLVLFAIVYLVAATVWQGRYNAWLERGVNKLRWAAFGLGGGVMAVAVAMLSGITDLAYLVLISGSVLVACAVALAVGLLGLGRRLRKLLVIIALIAAVLPVVAILSAIVGTLLFNGSLPAFVYYIYASMFLAIVALGLASYFRLRLRGRWADTVYTERMCMVLGFVISSILAWQIFAGALQP